jgi:hypothetical protein
MTLIKPALKYQEYKPKHLKVIQVLRLARMLRDYYRFPHYSMRDEILEYIDNLLDEVIHPPKD